MCTCANCKLPTNNMYLFHYSNAKQMPVDVMDSLKYVCRVAGGLSDSESEQYLNTLETKRLLQQETWA